MSINDQNIAVLGDGGWGTTLSILLAKKGLHVNLWSAFAENADAMTSKRENAKFLPGFSLPVNITISSDIEYALETANLAIIAIPSQYLRKTLSGLKGFNLGSRILISVVKGIENQTFKRPSEIICDELGGADIGILSGPTIAHEIANGLPASCVISSKDPDVAMRAQRVFMTEKFRVYTSEDTIGVELAGALKNIFAIASGISDGLGLGSNAKAALFTRGLLEMKRLGVYLGGKAETFNGLSGMGDLVTTCISPYSRNRSLGESISRGNSLSNILDNMEMVAEGVETTRSVFHLAKKIGIDMPITEQVYNVLFKGKAPHTAVADLMTRDMKAE
jgi:glycerol-3-phosphate dehydrogenase (NAD(P)+)